VDQVREQVQSRHQIKDEAILSRWSRTTKGFAAKLDSSQVKQMKNDPQVAKVKPNIYYKVGVGSLAIPEAPRKELLNSDIQAGGQILPWGVERVRGPYDGTGKTAWIMDTGIDLDHPDLNVDVNRSISFIAGEDPDDFHGHGTHVAGILAAIDNDIDAVGVAAGATVVAVKVCQDAFPQPVCPTNAILDGIEYVTNNANSHEMVNMSIWGPADSDLDNAIISAASNSIPFTISAGNASDDASNYSPGRANHYNIRTISAFREGDIFAFEFPTHSNFGNPPVDFAGPGENIFSLWRNGGTQTISGTSMAAPHVAGIRLAVAPFDPDSPLDNPVPTDGTINGDQDSNPDRIAVLPSDLSVFISGSSFVTNGQTGHWDAIFSGGEDPFSYMWFRNVYQYPLWEQVGTGSSYSQTVTDSFELKVRVTDDTGTIVTSSVFNVVSN